MQPLTNEVSREGAKEGVKSGNHLSQKTKYFSEFPFCKSFLKI